VSHLGVAGVRTVPPTIFFRHSYPYRPKTVSLLLQSSIILAELLVVTTGAGARIGVEHASLYIEDSGTPSGRQMKAQEKIQDQTARRAFEIFRGQLSTALYLTVEFSEPYNYSNRDVQAVAESLSTAVLQSLALTPRAFSAGQDVRVEEWQFQHRGLPFPRGVSSFHYSVQIERRFELWGAQYAYMVPDLSTAKLELVIQKKEKLINSYLNRCDKSLAAYRYRRGNEVEPLQHPCCNSGAPFQNSI